MKPSIWTGSYGSHSEWRGHEERRRDVDRIHDDLEEGLLHPLNGNVLQAWCAACQTVRQMGFTFHLAMMMPEGSVRFSQTETGICQGCNLNSRMRAVIDVARSTGTSGTCLLAEQVTASTPVLDRLFDRLVPSEYLGPDVAPGSIHRRNGTDIRHEDFTRLSLPDGSVDMVITQDVFEHIPDFDRAFIECRRVLRPGGHMLFTIPFFPEQAHTEVIARVRPDGTVEHKGLPEIHGNPLGGGSLCFQHFGWDILDRLRAAGFSRAVVHTYRGAWQGHLSGPSFVFDTTA